MFLYTQYTLSPLLPCHKLFQLFSSIPFLTKKAILTTRLRESLTSFLRTVLTTYFFFCTPSSQKNLTNIWDTKPNVFWLFLWGNPCQESFRYAAWPSVIWCITTAYPFVHPVHKPILQKPLQLFSLHIFTVIWWCEHQLEPSFPWITWHKNSCAHLYLPHNFQRLWTISTTLAEE